MECSIRRGRVKKLNSAAPVKAVGGKWLNVSGGSGVGFLESWAAGSAFPGAQLFLNEPEQECWGGDAWGCHPLALEQARLSSVSRDGGLQPDSGGPNAHPSCAA